MALRTITTNPTNPGEPTQMPYIPWIGTIVTSGTSPAVYYEILSTRTYQDEPAKFRTLAVLLHVSDEGDDLGEEPITDDISGYLEV